MTCLRPENRRTPDEIEQPRIATHILGGYFFVLKMMVCDNSAEKLFAALGVVLLHGSCNQKVNQTQHEHARHDRKAESKRNTGGGPFVVEIPETQQDVASKASNYPKSTDLCQSLIDTGFQKVLLNGGHWATQFE